MSPTQRAKRKKAKPLPEKPKHNRKGNCWDVSIIYDCKRCHLPEEVCDVCHKHDEPRGNCGECPRCAVCDEGAGFAESGSVKTKKNP